MTLSPLRLSKDQVDRMLKVGKPVFLRVQELTGVPWEAVAAVWYRESFSVAPPKTPGGPFQFDPEPISDMKVYCLSHYTKMRKEDIPTYAKMSVNDFFFGALMCACWLRHKTKFVIDANVSDEGIKDAFWGYNGKVFGAADKAPYVMSGYDAAHMGMIIRGTIPDKNAPNGRRRIVVEDKRPGAFTVYKQLRSLGV